MFTENDSDPVHTNGRELKFLHALTVEVCAHMCYSGALLFPEG